MSANTTAFLIIAPFILITIVLTCIIYRLMMPNRITVPVSLTENYSVLAPDGNLLVYSLHQPNKRDVPYSWAMVTVPEDDSTSCILWMIYTREKYRNSGYGCRLVKVLQQKYDYIYTQYERGIVGSPGVRLMLKCGFVMHRQMFKNQPPTLEWKR